MVILESSVERTASAARAIRGAGPLGAVFAMSGALIIGAANADPSRAHPAGVDERRLLGADREPGNWMAPGRTLGEQHFSPLRKINADNVRRPNRRRTVTDRVW